MAPNVAQHGHDTSFRPISSFKTQIKREVKRDHIFTQHDEPFGFSQHSVNRVYFLTAHVIAIYFTYLTATKQVPASVFLCELFWWTFGAFGTTVGCHRFWSHKTFKANLPFQYLLMAMQTVSFQYPIHKWCLDHRLHHKYTDTDADPHNSKRGFWYSHIGWLMLPKTEEFNKKLQSFDMPDLENDSVVRFQSKHYKLLLIIFHFSIPIWTTYYFWKISFFHCVCSNIRRHIVSLHATWCVNSVAHLIGDRPYDKDITPRENFLVSLITIGEGWHNYHHTFPWDYRASEYGSWKVNPSSLFIDAFAAFGWTYDLKTVSQKMLRERLSRTGDGTHAKAKHETGMKDGWKHDFDYVTPNDVTELMKTIDKPIWGWDDASIPDEFRQVTRILRPTNDLGSNHEHHD